MISAWLLSTQALPLELWFTAALLWLCLRCWMPATSERSASPREPSGSPSGPPRDQVREGRQGEGEQAHLTQRRSRWSGSASEKGAPRGSAAQESRETGHAHKAATPPTAHQGQRPWCTKKAMAAGEVTLAAVRWANPPVGLRALEGETEHGPSKH